MSGSKRSDSDIIEAFRSRFRIALPQVPADDDYTGADNNIYDTTRNLYATDRDGRVVGLNLRALDLEEIPEEVFSLHKLRILYLSSNRLTTISPRIAELAELEALWLGSNQITTLPAEVARLPKLRVLNLYKSPLGTPPEEIVAQGLDAIRAYFDEIETGDTTRLYEAKVLLVGQGSVGKTLLARRLVHDVVDPSTETTEGIDIEHWTLRPRDQERSINVNIWDFGGQEIYHATHQFFLTKRSLYVFVWESRTDADLLSFDYWLNTIAVLTRGSPVLVVQNKVDEGRKSINQVGWRRTFPNITEFHDVSALVGTGIDELRAAMYREIAGLSHIGDLLPKRWTEIRSRLEALESNYISYSNYLAVCAEFGMDRDNADRLSEYYHDLGVFLNFKANPILSTTLFLVPEWVTNAVYAVLDNELVKSRGGRFDFSDLGGIWADSSVYPPEIYPQLIELMKSFELCFELPSRGYIVPELVPSNQPSFAWSAEGSLRFQYIYEFMPSGIMSRFIVNVHDLIEDEKLWKDGVVLNWEGTRGVVMKVGSRTIEVGIHGGDRKALLAMIRRHMLALHESFDNLVVREMVPCICSECARADAPYFHPYVGLERARRKERVSVECQLSFEPVSIEALLGGIGDSPVRLTSAPRVRIRVFLASSSELRREREQIELLIGKENRRYFSRNIFLDLVIWEDLRQSFDGARIQDYFNEQMLSCDVVICLFAKKVGEFTREEFDVAYSRFRAGQNPRYLYVYFKSVQVDLDEVDDALLEVQRLKRSIEQVEQMYGVFNNENELVLKVKGQLDLVVTELAAG